MNDDYIPYPRAANSFAWQPLQVDFARNALATRAQRWPLLAWPIWTRYSDWRVKAISIEYTEWVWKCMESSYCSDMTSINQPISQKSKSHYRVFLGKVQLDFTTSTEFKGDKICLKSHWHGGRRLKRKWSSALWRTGDSVGNIWLNTKWQYQGTVVEATAVLHIMFSQKGLVVFF